MARPEFKGFIDGPEEARASEIILHYAPTFVGEGAQQIVYAIPEHPRLVVKVYKPGIQRMQTYLKESGLTEPNEEMIGAVKERIRKNRAQYEELATYFKPHHLLRQRNMLARIPVPGEKQADGKRDLEKRLTWTLVLVQDKLPVGAVETDTVHGGYAEFRGDHPLDERQYWAVTDALLAGRDVSEADLREVQRKLGKTLDRVHADQAFRSLVREFCEDAVAYAMATGNTLDVAGKDNVVFQKDPLDRWNFFLVDAIDDRGKGLEKAQERLNAFAQGAALDKSEVNCLLNAFNFVRTINGFAQASGAAGRITSLASCALLSTEKKQSLLARLRVKETF